jgi:hypothetical protein
MATEDRTQPAPFINSDRLKMVHGAATGIAMMAAPMQRLTAEVDSDENIMLHQLAIRIEELSTVIVEMLDEEHADVDEARRTVLGPELHRRHRRGAATA